MPPLVRRSPGYPGRPPPRCRRRWARHDAAFPAWARTAPKDRAVLLTRVAEALEAQAAEYAALESRNTGKPQAAALNDELPAIADVFRYFAGACRSPQRPGGRRVPAWPHQHDPP